MSEMIKSIGAQIIIMLSYKMSVKMVIILIMKQFVTTSFLISVQNVYLDEYQNIRWNKPPAA